MPETPVVYRIPGIAKPLSDRQAQRLKSLWEAGVEAEEIKSNVNRFGPPFIDKAHILPLARANGWKRKSRSEVQAEVQLMVDAWMQTHQVTHCPPAAVERTTASVGDDPVLLAHQAAKLEAMLNPPSWRQSRHKTAAAAEAARRNGAKGGRPKRNPAAPA